MRLTEKEGEALLLAQDPIALGREADAVRRTRYGNRTTFIVDRNINYTNICRLPIWTPTCSPTRKSSKRRVRRSRRAARS